MSNAVTLSFAGDSTSLDRATKNVTRDLDSIKDKSQKAGHSTKDLGETLDKSTGKFRGGKDVLDGFSDSMGAMGLALPGPIGNIAMMAGGMADMADGVATTVLPALKGLWATMMANPLFLVIAGLVALTAAFVIAYKKSETFRNIVHGVFGAVKTAAVDMGKGLAKVAGLLFAPYRIAFNAIAEAWNHTIGGMSFHAGGFLGLPSVGFTIPNIPTFANGGQTKAGPMIVGERGPELFIPNVPGQVMANGRGSNGSGGSGAVVVEFGAAGDDLTGAIVAALRKHVRINGGGSAQIAFGR